MKYIYTDGKTDYYIDQFEGRQIRISKERATGKLMFNAEDVAKCFGFDTIAEMVEHNQDMTDA